VGRELIVVGELPAANGNASLTCLLELLKAYFAGSTKPFNWSSSEYSSSDNSPSEGL
jgi:hypothetical protein